MKECKKYKIKRSEFLSFCENIDNVNFLYEKIKFYKKKYYDASHICWAAIISTNEEVFEKSNDDKEPRGTAGIQILKQLKENKLKNVVVIVIRYFGGIKLGKKKLAESYKIATQKILNLE